MSFIFQQNAPQTQNATPNAKEYGMNKPMPFSGDQMKIKAFLQECLVYIDMNKEVYTTDKLKIGFVLSYMNEKKKDWRELYIESIEDPVTGKLVYPTFGTFLTDVCKAFWSVDHVQDVVHKLETLKQGKKTAEELITEFKQLVGQAGLGRKSRYDHIHIRKKSNLLCVTIFLFSYIWYTSYVPMPSFPFLLVTYCTAFLLPTCFICSPILFPFTPYLFH